MNVIRLIVAVLFVAAGVLLAALNAGPVVIDLFVTQIELSLGIAILLSVMIGAVLGGLALALGSALPARRKVRRAREQGRAEVEAKKAASLEPERL